MKVNLPVNRPQTTHEGPPKSPDNSENGSHSKFSLQMNQIAKAGVDHDNRNIGKNTMHSSDGHCDDPMSLARNASLLNIQPMALDRGELLPSPLQIAALDGDLLNAAMMPAAASGPGNLMDTDALASAFTNMDAGPGEKMFAAAPSNQDRALMEFGRSQDVQTQPAVALNDPLQQLSVAFSQIGACQQMQTSGASVTSTDIATASSRATGSVSEEEPSIETILKAASGAFATATESAFNRVGNAKIAPPSGEKSDASSPDVVRSHTTSPESAQGIFAPLELRTAQGNSTLSEDMRAFKDFNARSANTQTAGAPGAGNSFDAASQNSSPADAHTNSDAFQNPSFPWTASQLKLDSAQPDPVRPRSSTAEFKQDLSSPIISNSTRFVESGNPMQSSSEKTAMSQSRDLIFELTDRIQIMLRDGRGEIRIQLKPESLGNLEIRAESTSNGVVARIFAESSSVKHYLENNLQTLQQNLQDQGLRIDRIQVAVQDGYDSQSSSGFTAQFGHAGSGQFEREQRRHSESTASAAEELTVDPLTLDPINTGTRFHTVA
jgi:flagellar hook-length control protein FliK